MSAITGNSIVPSPVRLKSEYTLNLFQEFVFDFFGFAKGLNDPDFVEPPLMKDPFILNIYLFMYYVKPVLLSLKNRFPGD